LKRLELKSNKKYTKKDTLEMAKKCGVFFDTNLGTS